MSRLVLSLAGVLTAGCALGASALIASDFLGEDGMRTLWSSLTSIVTSAPEATPASSAGGAPAPFEPTKEIHFFEQMPIEDTGLVVSTGSAYPSLAAAQAEQPSHRWCYVIIASGQPGVSERIDLGTQQRDEPPIYGEVSTYAAPSLADHGLSAERLVLIARTHCRFAVRDA